MFGIRKGEGTGPFSPMGPEFRYNLVINMNINCTSDFERQTSSGMLTDSRQTYLSVMSTRRVSATKLAASPTTVMLDYRNTQR